MTRTQTMELTILSPISLIDISNENGLGQEVPLLAGKYKIEIVPNPIPGLDGNWGMYPVGSRTGISMAIWNRHRVIRKRSRAKVVRRNLRRAGLI